jgi:hypothetical protein
MLAIAARSEREFCVDYACRCRVMYVCGGPPICTSMLFISPFRAGPKGALVDTASIMKHPRIRHFDVFSSLFPHSNLAIVARHARFVPVRSLGYHYADLPQYGYILTPTSLAPPTYIPVRISLSFSTIIGP